MFSFHHRPDADVRDNARLHRHFRFVQAESLEARRSPSIIGLSEAVDLSGPAGSPRAPQQAVAITGTVLANGPVVPRANALLFDEDLPGTPSVFAVPLHDLGGGRYAFDLPMNLSTSPRAGGGHAGHRYAVAITVGDSGIPATTSTTFTVGGAAPQHDAARLGHPHPSGRPHRA